MRKSLGILWFAFALMTVAYAIAMYHLTKCKAESQALQLLWRVGVEKSVSK